MFFLFTLTYVLCYGSFFVFAEQPTIMDPNLKVEQVVDRLHSPTSMAFLDLNDILVLDKDKGTVERIISGNIQTEPLLDANVSTKDSRGMLGVDVAKYKTNRTTIPYVFLYYTESKTKDAEDVVEGVTPLGNRVYRYELVNDKLIKPKLLLDLPSSPIKAEISERKNIGGKLVILSNNYLYVTTGDLSGGISKVQNIKNGTQADGTSGILRVTPEGAALKNESILGVGYPLEYYFAYGIRNSFGIDFDPITGHLWDTENGPDYGDEINLVEPGFNSGWETVMGQASFQKNFSERNLADFDGKGRYSDPEFVWNQSIGVTDLVFLNSDKLGKEYQNDLFVADINFGNIYHFKLNETRTGLLLNNTLKDKIANNIAETKGIIFARGFGGITDLEVGPDGNLYVLSGAQGKLYRISDQQTPKLEPKPTIMDPNLKVERVVDRLDSLTSMAFLDSNDILVLNKDKGTVERVINGIIQLEPLLDANVSTNSGRGMLGVDVAKYKTNGTTIPYVFLYYTESKTKDAEDVVEGVTPLGNRVYRYELVNDKLIKPKLLLDLPSSPTKLDADSLHTGGKVLVGPDQNIYSVIGDIGAKYGHRTLAQNVKNGTQADGTSGILRVTPEGAALKNESILGEGYPLEYYFAYGIRNSFGIDFDPITGHLWDTENGPDYGDEINLVEPGFNSGYIIIQGFTTTDKYNFQNSSVDFDGKGRYSDPEFVWNQSIGVTDLVFLNSDKLGKEYQNDLFVADINFGNIYHFKLNETRTGLLLNDTLKDKIANNIAETKGIIFARGFGGITDLEVGPDGNLYVLSRIHGAIYRVSQINK